MPTCEPQRFQINQVVEYYSSSYRKWYETSVVNVHPDATLDLKCRKNVNPTLVRPRQNRIGTAPSEQNQRHPTDQNRLYPVSSFEIGSKVEYFSDTMNGWVFSYVKGVNPDGTYRLNTKKAAHASRIRHLFEPAISVRQVTSPMTPVPHPMVHGGPFLTSLRVSSFRSPFDLALMRSELLSSLAIPSTCSFRRMTGFTGGQNDGIWFASTPTVDYCLKLVKSDRKFAAIPSERENYLELLGRFPGIRSDPYMTFPRQIIQLLDAASNRSVYDVICMPVAPGERMAEVISKYTKEPGMLAQIFSAVGTRLAQFHREYGNTQHCDLQSSNIFVAIQPVRVTLIDLGGMGTNPNSKDVEYFRDSIGLLARTYGSEFERVASRSFIEGYSSTR